MPMYVGMEIFFSCYIFWLILISSKILPGTFARALLDEVLAIVKHVS
jgi:hypothetical protein